MSKQASRFPVAPVLMILLATAFLVVSLVRGPKDTWDWVSAILFPACFMAMGIHEILRRRRLAREGKEDDGS